MRNDSLQLLDGGPPRVLRGRSELLFDAKQLVVFRRAVRS